MRFLLLLCCGLLLFGTACDDNDNPEPEPPEDNLAVAATIIRLIVSGGSQGARTFSYRQVPPVDGVAQPPEVDDITLDANTNYTYRIIVLGEDTNGTRTLTDEVEADGEDYLFTFDVLAADITIVPNDEDQFGDPIGLTGTIQTGDTSSGVLMFDLFFETNKASPGSSGDRILGGDYRVEIQ